MKNYTIIAIMLVMGLILSGCSMVEVNEERDAQTVIATIGEEVVEKGDYQELYDMYVMYGQLPAEAPTDEASLIYYELNVRSIVDQLVDQKVQVAKAKELGLYSLSDEESQEILEEVNSIIETYASMYSGELSFDEAYADKTEEELLEIAKEQIDDYLVNFGYTKEALTNDYTDQLVLEKLFNTTVESIEVTEDEVKAEYDKNVSEQGLGMEEGTVSYESLANSGESVYFTPAGVRQAQHILISISEEDSAAISQLETNGDTEGADAAREEAFAAIKDSADEAYNRAVAGEDFALLIEELNEDPGMDGTNYYYVLEDTMQFVPEFAAGLFSLNAVGDISEPVATSFGYHIIKYFGDEPSGEVNFDDVHDEIYDSMLSTKQDEYFLAEMETWKESMDIDVKYDRVLD